MSCYAECEICGSSFTRGHDEDWKRKCLRCWRATKRTEQRDDADECMRWYRKGYAAGLAAADAQRTPEPAVLDAEHIRALIRLAHPDLHGGSELATRTTAWLLDLRRRVSA
jgi:hypothetical protein